MGGYYFQPVRCLLLGAISFSLINVQAQEHSIARQWNEKLLGAIQRDFARPPVQARNLYHVSAAMYEAWAAYDPKAEPFLLGRTRAGYTCPFDGLPVPDDVHAAREQAISFAAYRLIAHRFQNSPGIFTTMLEINDLMDSKGYAVNNTSQDYLQGGPAELGNYIAAQIIAYGMQDGSNEQFNFSNQYYGPVNVPMVVADPGNPNMTDPNRWQQLTLAVAIDQQGNPVPSTAPFQSPEWGNVDPFGLTPGQMVENVRDGHTYKVYLDPGPPAYLDTTLFEGLESFYKWNFCMVPIWQSHLDPADDTMIDISPASKGNIQTYPQTEQEIRDFYDYFNGGDPGIGHAVNPATGSPYAPQIVKRGDYTRILAEFWADGPNSETPPGHWFSIMHTAMDHPLFERRWMGQGEELDELEYDVRSHLVLGGALHDAAIAAWGIKGWYDYVRPISAVRYMADKGQCSDPLQPGYHPAGLPLIPGYIELVQPGDPLAGDMNEHVGKPKLYTWLGPEAIDDPETDHAGVGWLLAENWYPYQRPTFVTPPFAGYISGHSTYSRSAAEVLTAITGDPYFPGGMSNFHAPQNEFLVFEEGPTEDIYLQWATYRDASDQCSLSRIWGGIHPPVDDIPGRHLGIIIGPQAVAYGNTLFHGERPVITDVVCSDPVVNSGDIGGQFTLDLVFDMDMDQSVAPVIAMMIEDPLEEALSIANSAWTASNTYTITYVTLDAATTLRDIHMRVDSAVSADGKMQDVQLIVRPFLIDLERPTVASIEVNTGLINDAIAAQEQLQVTITMNEECDTQVAPAIGWTSLTDLSATLVLDQFNSGWIDASTYVAIYQVNDNEEEVELFGAQIGQVMDAAGNEQLVHTGPDLLSIDTRGPITTAIVPSSTSLNAADAGEQALVLQFQFDEVMDMDVTPVIEFENGDPIGSSLIAGGGAGVWLDAFTYEYAFGLADVDEEFGDLLPMITGVADLAGNAAVPPSNPPSIQLDTREPAVLNTIPSALMVADVHAGGAGLSITAVFSEAMDVGIHPQILLVGDPDPASSLIHEPAMDQWLNNTTFQAYFDVLDEGVEIANIAVVISGALDLVSNEQLPLTQPDVLALDTRNPLAILLTANTYLVTEEHVGAAGVYFISVFDEPMAQDVAPLFTFDADLSMVLEYNANASGWLNGSTHRSSYDVASTTFDLAEVSVQLAQATDAAGNPVIPQDHTGLLGFNIAIVGVDEAHAGVFSIRPNPIVAGEEVRLELPDASAPTITVHDQNGRKVLEQQHQAGPGSMVLHTGGLASGSYLVTVIDDGVRAHARLVIITR